MKLLIAEDEKSLNKTIAERLTRSGYTVDSCFDGEDALYYIESTQYDGIILDVMMPKMNGFEVLRIIREKKILTPVLIGISSENLEKIWDRFYRVDDVRNDEYGSSGLGLSMVKSIVELHNGKIFVKSQLGKGTEFRIVL